MLIFKKHLSQLTYDVFSFIIRKNHPFWAVVFIFLCWGPLLAQEIADDDLEDVFELVEPTQEPTKAPANPPTESTPPPQEIIHPEILVTPPPPTAEELFQEDKDLEDVFDVVPLPQDAPSLPPTENVEFSVEPSSFPTSPTAFTPVSLDVEKPLSYHQVHIQFGERRVSKEGKDEFWGAGGVQIKVLGTTHQVLTNSLGQALLQGIPADGELLLYAYDPQGVYENMIHEVSVPAQPGTPRTSEYRIERIQIRKDTFQSWLHSTGVEPSSSLGHICGDIKASEDGSHDKSGYSVNVDAHSDGIYYFNTQGHLDTTLKTTSNLGRFCAFNIDPGEVVVDVSHPLKAHTLSQLTTVSATRLTFSTFHHNPPTPARLPYVIAPTPLELISHNPLPHPLPPRNVHLPPLITLEDHRTSAVEAPHGGRTWSQVFLPHVSTWEGYIHVTVQEQKWEPALFRLPAWSWQKGKILLNLLPRGAIAELTKLIGLPYYKNSAHIWITHGLRAEEKNQKLTHELWDDKGRIYSSPWGIKQSTSLLRTGYFNLEEGRYLWVLKSADGSWLASKIIKVLPHITSMVHTGRPLLYTKSLSSP